MASHPSRRNYRVLRLDARRRVLLHATPVAAVRLSKRMDRLEIFTACPSLRQGARERARAAVVRSIPSVQRSGDRDRKSTRLNSSHVAISYAVFCLKKKKQIMKTIIINQ